MREVILQGRRVRLDDADLLGAGGEAQVFGHGGLALKVFHPIDPGLPGPERVRLGRLLALKREKLARFPAGLPDALVAPLHPLTDSRGELVGYAMPRVDGAQDLVRLSQRRWREGRVGNAQVQALFVRLRTALLALHARGVVVGDLNDTNVLFREDAPFLIDADSVQFAGLACAVAHERFLDPRLYGVDLAAAPAFSPQSDWYAFAVQLFQSLLYVHPFGGVHPKHPTLLRRAEARVSAFCAGVQLPKAAAPLAALPTALAGWLRAVFEEELRAPPPEAALRSAWTACPCGTEHAQPSCPSCATRARSFAVEATLDHGRCRVRRVFRTRGRILAAALHGRLRFVAEEDGRWHREDGAAFPAPGAATRVALGGASLFASLAGERSVLELDHSGRLIARHACAHTGGEPAFDASGAGGFLVNAGWLSRADGARVGQVLEGRTWFRAGPRFGLGFYRAGRCTFWFTFRAGGAGLRDARLPPIEGRVLDASCVFDAHHALVTLATEVDGQVRHTALLVHEDGALVGTRSARPDEDRALESLHGKAVLGGRVLVATRDGLCTLEADPRTGRLEDGRLFPDTRPFVDPDGWLFATPEGSAVVVGTQEITELTLN